MGGLKLHIFPVKKADILTDCAICGHGVAMTHFVSMATD